MIEPGFLKSWLMQYGAGAWNYSPRLIATFSNNYWIINIPVQQSPDFEGDMGKLSIIPSPGIWGNFHAVLFQVYEMRKAPP